MTRIFTLVAIHVIGKTRLGKQYIMNFDTLNKAVMDPEKGNKALS